MTPLTMNDVVALVAVVLAALSLFANLVIKRKQNGTVLKNMPALSALSAFQHEAAEKGSRLTFGLGEGFSSRSVSISGLQGLSVWRDSAAKAVFNDQLSQAVSGSGALTTISQMVLRGVYQGAVATELFKPEQILMGGTTDAASVAGLIPEVNHTANSAVALIGNFAPLAGLAVSMAGRQHLPTIAMGDTLAAQTTFFVTTPLSSLGEDYFGAEASLSRQTNAESQLRAQDWLRIAAVLALLVGAILKLTGAMP